jgi:2-keto-4-pentenoate hydratase/2-oxohepta-3-ene-1,7-dioic acid hydratase in catechol pathway
VRIANISGRLALVVGADRAVDVATASGGLFAADPQAVYERWEEFVAWAGAAEVGLGTPFSAVELGPPAPTPRQVFAIGLNYRDHATEAGFGWPEHPTVFTKFASCLTGADTEVDLPEDGHTDWEVELVAVIGRRAVAVDEAQAWDHIAGVAVGQDLSERSRQMRGPAPQFSLAKSLPGFGPVGPWLVTADELADPDDLALGCSVNGELVQQARTADMVFSVPRLVSLLSQELVLLPGDVLFTGTPAGVGMGRDPQVWLAPGDELVSWVEGIGELRQQFRSDGRGPDDRRASPV